MSEIHPVFDMSLVQRNALIGFVIKLAAPVLSIGSLKTAVNHAIQPPNRASGWVAPCSSLCQVG
jgi:hypothetical protein